MESGAGCLESRMAGPPALAPLERKMKGRLVKERRPAKTGVISRRLVATHLGLSLSDDHKQDEKSFWEECNFFKKMRRSLAREDREGTVAPGACDEASEQVALAGKAMMTATLSTAAESHEESDCGGHAQNVDHLLELVPQLLEDAARQAAAMSSEGEGDAVDVLPCSDADANIDLLSAYEDAGVKPDQTELSDPPLPSGEVAAILAELAVGGALAIDMAEYWVRGAWDFEGLRSDLHVHRLRQTPTELPAAFSSPVLIGDLGAT